MPIYYTHKERTEKKYTTEDAVTATLFILKDKYNLSQVCVNLISKKSPKELFTTAELNQLTEDMLDDTLYYDGYKIK